MNTRNKVLLTVVMFSIGVGIGLGYLLYKRNEVSEKMKRNGLESLGYDDFV